MNKPTITLRDPHPGDVGWVVQQHREIYWREYRWDMRFEALVSGIVSSYVTNDQSGFEQCRIAEVDGVRAGSAFVVRESKTTGQLRLLILTPEARGLGLGGKLCDECIAFARATGYKTMTLWTNACLPARWRHGLFTSNAASSLSRLNRIRVWVKTSWATPGS